MDPQLVQISELAISLIGAIVAYWQYRGKGRAVQQAGEVIAFFDPDNGQVTSPPVQVPTRSWKMNAETRRWVIAGHSPDDQASLLKQSGKIS